MTKNTALTYKKTLLHFKELSDILRLTVPEEEGKREVRNYTFSQLQDLQSRLMLVAGKAEKGSENVDRFTMASFFPKIYFSSKITFLSCLYHETLKYLSFP